ncbi:hypothetical protein PUN28_012363 [Cardiocondyla obscurior]|uniref:phospholipase A1 n=2 Tax=Cardiocondyla obscurior TaxID=286306 RepID=A0AAW2FCY5_9HYME
MKTVAIILVIFLVQCAYLRAEPRPGMKENVGKMLHSDSCIFGVNSVSTYFYNSNIKGENVSLESICNDPRQFDSTEKIAFVTHGFVSSPKSTAFQNMTSELVQAGYSVFMTDWSQGACTEGIPIFKFVGYPSAVRNTREIGQFLARIIYKITYKCKVPLKNFTLIGHSLGAHVSAFAAKEIKKLTNASIPLLLAADPADPLFGTRKCDERLCKTDADHIVVAHTSILGIPYDVGHVDLQYNNGKWQPGCNIADVSCSHGKSVEYLTDVLKSNCSFPGIPTEYRKLDLFPREPPYPSSNTTDCILVNKKIYDSNNPIKGRYYVFVKNPECTQETFSCEQQ